MTINLSTALGLPSVGPNDQTLEVTKNTHPVLNGQNFGQWMSDVFQQQANAQASEAQTEADLARSEGQQIAASLLLADQDATLGAQAWSLKSVTLGPHLSIITPETSPPDAQSLEAFARAQGLDETAVQWLFGGTAHTPPSPAITVPTPSLTNGLASDISIEASGGWPSAQVSTVTLGLVKDTFPAITPAGDTSGAGAGTGSGTANALQAQVLHQSTVLGAATTGLLSTALASAQGLLAVVDDPNPAPKVSTPNSTEDALPIQLLRMPPPAAVWMQRSAMNTTLQDSATTPKETAISLSELDLGADWGGETLQQLLGTEGEANSASTGPHGTAHANFASRWDAQTKHSTELNNAANTAPDLPDANVRSENIQNLADKMGQAVGQRILSEMEKGQWHLKLQLRPATLGHIEIEMRMRSGEFDAVFTAPNTTTRDLLQDGMAKLRDTLSQMGMNIAYVHVGDGQTGQSGGDSTPGFAKGKPAQTQALAQESTAEIPRAPRVKDPRDGLDVLV